MGQKKEVHVLTVVWVLMLLSAGKAQLKWLSRPQHTVVALSQDLVLDCQAVEEVPSGGSLKYTWLFNNSTLQTKVHFFANASLFVPRVTQQDVGNYSCTVMVGDESQGSQVSAVAQVILAFIDDFVVHPQNTTTTLATDVTLTCVTGRSAPYPAVSWEMDGQVLEDGRTVAATYGAYDGVGLSVQVSMKMTRRMTDERLRSFRCVARNVLMGQTVKSRQAVVSVQVTPAAPRIISSTSGEVVVVQHQQVTFDCKVQSYPPSLIRWFKNEEALNTSTNNTSGHQCDLSFCSLPLVLAGAVAEDAGMYSCRASNSEGFAVSNTTRLVFAYLALDFKVQPSDTNTLAGSAVTLHCTPPDSVPPASVTWYKNFLPFAERAEQFAASVRSSTQGGWNLYFVSVQENDAGQYYCVASNNYTVPGSRTSIVARLTVTGSPLITEPPLSTQIVKGSLLHLRCMVDFSAVTTVYWLYGGKKIESSQTVSLINRGQDLWVSNVGKSWEGIFTCVAENSLGQKSATAMVVVVVPPVKLEDIGERQASVGSTVLLPCSIYGDPTPSISWFHNDQQIFTNERMTLLLAGLFIDKVAVTDRGNHACLGKNIGGQIWSNGTLDVTVPPTISVDTQNISAAVSQSLTLTCKADGHPSPSVDWLHNDSSILDGLFVFSSRNTSLTIPSFTWSLAGQYTCIASNIEGTTSVVFTVTAQAPPRVIGIVGSTQVNVNTNINLTCVYQGAPSPVVTWFSAGKRIMSSLDGRVGFPQVDKLMIMFAQKSDEGLYTCLASNILGNSSFSVKVLVTEPPRPPELLEAQPLSTSSVLLKWKPASQGPGTMVNAFVIRYRERDSSDNFLYPEKISPLTVQQEISGLKPGVEYIFTVSAQNSAGEGPASNSLVAMTFPLGPSVPRNVKILSTTPTTAEVSWEIPAQSNGIIRIYQLLYRPYLAYTDYTALNVTTVVFPTQTVVVKQLQPYTMYQLQVRAATMWEGLLMWGNFSHEMTVQTNITAPSGSPSSIRAIALDPFSFRVDWQPVPISQQHGPITGYKLTYWLQSTGTQLGSILCNSSQQTAVVKGLAPWTLFLVTLEAENSKGFGPKSDYLSVKTLPIAPSAPPQGVTAMALPGNKIDIDWQPVPDKDQNCEIAQYLVQYRTKQTEWKDLYTSNNHTFSMQVENLVPWTWYEVQVAAVTKQVSPGLGPFSGIVEIKTLQGVPGPVQNVSFHAGITDIYLVWKTPAKLNGVLTGYRLDYQPLSVTDLNEWKAVMVITPYTELSDLLPDTEYNITIRAISGGGAGDATFLKVWTVAQPSPTSSLHQEPQTLEEVMETLTTTAATSAGSKNLPAIVGGTLVGVAILVTICMIFLCRWCRSKNENSAKYLIQDGTTQFSGYGSGSFYRHIEESSNTSLSNQHASSSFSDHYQQQQQHDRHFHHYHKGGQQQVSSSSQHQAANNNTILRQLPDTSWLTQQAHQTEDGSRGPSVYLPLGGTDIKPVCSPGTTSFKGVFTIDGMDNLGFVSDSLSLPGLPSDNCASSPLTAEGGLTAAQTKKRGRMSSESAAAIAMLRSSRVTSLIMDDTEALLTHEFSNIPTEVVFKHRTVL